MCLPSWTQRGGQHSLAGEGRGTQFRRRDGHSGTLCPSPFHKALKAKHFVAGSRGQGPRRSVFRHSAQGSDINIKHRASIRNTTYRDPPVKRTYCRQLWRRNILSCFVLSQVFFVVEAKGNRCSLIPRLGLWHIVGRVLCFSPFVGIGTPGGRGTLAGERGVGRVPIPTRGHTLWYS